MEEFNLIPASSGRPQTWVVVEPTLSNGGLVGEQQGGEKLQVIN